MRETNTHENVLDESVRTPLVALSFLVPFALCVLPIPRDR